LVGFDIAVERLAAHYGWGDDWLTWRGHIRKTLANWAPETFAREDWAALSEEEQQLWRDARDHRVSPYHVVQSRLQAGDPEITAVFGEFFDT
jgi:hypothetical protein